MVNLAKVGVVEEQKLAHQKRLEFESRSRCLKQFGRWAAGQMRKDGDEALAYMRRVLGIGVSTASDEDVVELVHRDFLGQGLEWDRGALRAVLADCGRGRR
jgi:hypothetical protein